MALVLFGMSFQGYVAIPEVETVRFSESDALKRAMPAMTEIFRLAFQSSFSSADIFSSGDVSISKAEATISLLDYQVIYSSSSRLDGTEGDDYFLVVALDLNPTIIGLNIDKFWREGFGTIEQKKTLLLDLGLGNILDRLSVNPDRLIGQNSYILTDDKSTYHPTMLRVFAFYLYGWVLSLRAERNQLTAQLSINLRTSRSRAREIALQRLRVINLSRYFLTDDRTNDPQLKVMCDGLRKKLKLDVRYERLAALHKDFEHHLDNTSKIAQSEQLSSVSNLIAILTVLSIPISFFSAIVAVNLQSPVFTATSGVLLDYRVYCLFALGIFVALTPFAMLRVLDIVRQRNDR